MGNQVSRLCRCTAHQELRHSTLNIENIHLRICVCYHVRFIDEMLATPRTRSLHCRLSAVLPATVCVIQWSQRLLWISLNLYGAPFVNVSIRRTWYNKDDVEWTKLASRKTVSLHGRKTFLFKMKSRIGKHVHQLMNESERDRSEKTHHTMVSAVWLTELTYHATCPRRGGRLYLLC